VTLVEKALEIAASQVGVTEVPPRSNRGPEVDAYVRAVGLDPTGAYPWCAAFVYWCFWKAAGQLAAEAGYRFQIPNPCPRTGSALGMWLKAKPSQQVPPNGPIKPGMVFVLELGHGSGHVGFVESVGKREVVTIEGNTNEGGSREGVGVFRRKRAFGKSLRGFLDFSIA
jgi:hypothetical protein